MELFVTWCGFIGAWLLFAGPIYQAAIELREEDIEDERIRAAAKLITPPADISAWWWLLPPIKIVLERRRSKAYRRAFLTVLSAEDIEALVTFLNKATGWLFVAGGGLLIATKETYELVQAEHWSLVVFWITIVVLAIISLANTAYRIARSERVLSGQHK